MKTDAVGGLAGEVKPPRNEPLPSPGGVLLALIGRYDENVGRFVAASRSSGRSLCTQLRWRRSSRRQARHHRDTDQSKSVNSGISIPYRTSSHEAGALSVRRGRVRAQEDQGTPTQFRSSAKPSHASGSATAHRMAIGRKAAPANLASRIPDNKVSTAVEQPEPNA